MTTVNAFLAAGDLVRLVPAAGQGVPVLVVELGCLRLHLSTRAGSPAEITDGERAAVWALATATAQWANALDELAGATVLEFPTDGEAASRRRHPAGKKR